MLLEIYEQYVQIQEVAGTLNKNFCQNEIIWLENCDYKIFKINSKILNLPL